MRPGWNGLEFSLPGSNNTGELQALMEALDFLLRRKSWVKGTPVTIYTDSQFVYDIFREDSNPTSHPELIALIRGLFFRLLTFTRVALVKVRSHAGNVGNDRADSLAKKGVTFNNGVGRHSPPQRGPLPPLISTFWPSAIEDIDDQARVLSESLRIAASALTPPTADLYKKEYLSTSTKALISRIEATPNDDFSTL